MPEKAEIFEKIHQDYLDRLAGADWAAVARAVGGEPDGDGLVIPFFNRPYHVSGRDIVGPTGRRPHHAVSVVLSQYVLLRPAWPPRGDDWISYRDFKDASPYVGGFLDTAERPIARDFRGRVRDLEAACLGLGGVVPEDEVACDLSLRLPALPRIPLWLIFHDADEEFPAKCLLLFERRAGGYLDMECLAMIGGFLAADLKRTLR
ncbi:MAG: DUF3786 domain-containing protein [Proteobacteria bacterium]|nr:DUF3786 domain-containing protein [Pseudomonadota bacterium]